MIEVSNAFKEAARAPVKTIRAKITCDGNEYTSADDFISLTKEDTGNYFGVATKSLTFQLIGAAHNLIGKTAEVSFEIQNGDTWELCNLGLFVVYEQTANLEKGITDFKAYDLMGVMGKTQYETGSLTFPCTVENLFEQIANKFGLAKYATNVANLSYQITEDLYTKISGTTYRDILAEIAGATASLCEITRNSIQLRPIETISAETLTYANLKKAKLEPKYGPVNSVVLARTPVEDNIVVTDDESIAENGRTEIKLANNEILDDNRETLAQPILDEVDGFYYYPFEITTEGHGWYEVGDRLSITDGTNTWEVIVTSISLRIGPGMTEIIKGVAPTETQTNYALAGGITKTIYNTEIKVDKQGQTIESIVEEQTTLENQVNENYTTITQTISDVITSVQNSGGNNLLKNSAMYSLDDNGLPLSWALSGAGTINIAPSAEAAVNGSLSRQNISLKGMTATQVVEVKADNSGITDKTYYSFSCKIKKTVVGECLVRITDGTETGVWEISLDNGEESFYDEYSLEGMLPNSSNLTVSVYGSNDSEFSINDMMLAVGDYKTQWTQANGEFANTQVSIDNTGVTIRSNTLDGTYTKQTPQELSAYSNNVLTATINNDGISAPKADFRDEITMSPIKIVPQRDGWAFVPTN
ncbi:hypothetical protein IKQ19_00695 [Candidatus Saccharibacteria bacterium]|nr:hypothetical protein [Candidatus Saccharibacteria bacterium]